MATGGHILLGQESNTPAGGALGMHWEEGVGWGSFPIALPLSTVYRKAYYYDPRSTSMDDVWLGADNSGDLTASYQSFIYTWNGTSWTTHTFSGGSIVFHGSMAVCRAPGTNIAYASYNANNGGRSQLYRYNGSTWSVIRGWGSFTGAGGGLGWFVPLALDSSTCVWISSEPQGGQSAYWIDANTRYTGGDIPNVGLRGIAELGGDIFILTSAGDVYRGSTPSGSFSLDNSTLGPFVDTFSSTNVNYMAASADGTTLVIQGVGDNYWVRDGSDNWTSYNTGLSTYQGIPCASDRQTLFRSGTSRCSISYDGGSSWEYADTDVGITGGTPLLGEASLAVIDEISNERRLLAGYVSDGVTWPKLWWKGDSPYSPWASFQSYNATPASGIREIWSLQGFESKHVVMSGWRNLGGEKHAIHYNPDLDSWSTYAVWPESSYMLSFGTEYAPGRLHGLIYRFGVSSLVYARWNGTSYDTSAIPGSSSGWDATAALPYHIQADDTGDDVWVVANLSGQLWHSGNGGTSWTNRYSSAAAVHTDADQARDVIVVSATEVYVCFESTGGEARFSKWDGATWSIAAPDLSKSVGRRSIYVANDGFLWFFESSSSGSSEAYKLVGGSWVLQDTYTYDNGTRDVTGIDSFPDESLMAISMERPNATGSYTRGALYQRSDENPFGWTPWRAYRPISEFTGLSRFGPEPPEPPVEEDLVLIFVEAINEYTIRAYFNRDVKRTDSSALDDATNPLNYALSGGYRELAVLSVAIVDAKTFDLTVLEMTDLADYQLTARVDRIVQV